MQRTKQLSLIKKTHWKFYCSHGGILRKKRLGRLARPLSKKEPLHLVFKANRLVLREKSFRGIRSYRVCLRLIKRYAKRFCIRIDQCSIQGDHIHLLVRCSDRFHYHAFFRVLAGQIAQRFRKEGLLRFFDGIGAKGKNSKKVTDTPYSSKTTHETAMKLWAYRPFTRIVKGNKTLTIVRNYIQLNEQEARGLIKYNSKRLAGLSIGDWSILWAQTKV